MDLARARIVIGVEPGTEWEQVRQAYRRQIQEAHPDRSGGSTERASQLNVAFAVLVRLHREHPLPDPPSASPAVDPTEPTATLAPDVELVGTDTLVIGAPADEAFRRVLGGLDLIGEITYVDRTGPIAEALVILDDGTSHSLVVSFQGRAAGTEVFATMEAIESVGTSSPTQVLRTLARFIPR